MKVVENQKGLKINFWFMLSMLIYVVKACIP